jgi:F-type H+-transporting ATPase subunit b
MNDYIGILVLSGDLGGLFDDIDEKLIPSWPSLVVQLCSLVVLILVVFFVAYKPVKKMLKKRADYIENNILDSQKNKAIAKQNLEQSNEAILSSKKEASRIISDANKKALNERKILEEETKLGLLRLKQEAETDIEKSKEQSLEDIRREMISVAMVTSKEILKREINEKDNAKLAEDFIEKLN